MANKKLKKARGLYEELLTKGSEGNKCSHDISKDLDRTFPNLPFFKTELFGHIG